VDEARLTRALAGLVGDILAGDLSADFVKIRQDYATRTFGRASAGKFVETFVQCLQHIDKGKHEAKPSVDSYLKDKAENTGLPEGLRICAVRIARSLYTLRNKRNIAHKNDVDPNTYDLAYLHQGASWIVAELLRNASGGTMQEAGALIELLQTPVGTLVEEIDGVRLIHGKMSTRTEVLILLHSHYPEKVASRDIIRTASTRSAASIRSRLSELRTEKLVFGNPEEGYRLTSPGFNTAVAELRKLASASMNA
jgi:hypothetical protein